MDVAIVGAGPAGAALAARLARAGIQVALLERSPSWRWRAGGVFASPAAVEALRRTGLDTPTLARVARPIPAMRVETARGTHFDLTYGADRGGPPAVGFDRSALDPALVDLAMAAGAELQAGVTVTSVSSGRAGDEASGTELGLAGVDGPSGLAARLVVGADGPRSIVAATAGVVREVRLSPRVGLTYHLADPRPDDAPVRARLRLLDDGYVGIAPVPGGRVNIGIVLGPSWRARLAERGAAAVAAAVIDAVPATLEDPTPWRGGPPCDAIAGASPLGVRVARRAGPGWFLVGDAAGFLDPFTGEGLHRALVSAELAAAAIRSILDGRAGPAQAAEAYERAMRRRFASKDLLSWLVQAFLARPTAFDYAARRLAARPDVRATMGLVMGDLVPASRGLDPRFLAALLAP
ncbi:MAG TPA: NAD(P)/FAD-dependent oxidoreductase [Candidatus Saccharimonadales bacterium]|nr:NAD(P)/FAD-dependent oxidoreductase [Candidatus Saccharimonadales bacterium]